MARFVRSPRARRRLLGAGALGSVLVVVGLVVALVPNYQPKSAPISDAPAQLAAATPRVHLTAADRRAIDTLLDRFIPAGMERRSPATAWALAGPELKSGSTLAAWRAGTSPVPYYPARETTFHHWQTIDVGPRYVIFNLLVHARPSSHLAPYAFSGQVVKRRGRWLVNRLYTIAIMNPVTRTTREIGPADFAAPAGSSQTPNGKPALGNLGIVPVVSILALILLIPFSLGIVALVRARRWRRLVRASARPGLPPLASRYRAAQDEQQQEIASPR
jgi:hypothetical protein